jgi:hypothetical protein
VRKSFLWIIPALSPLLSAAVIGPIPFDLSSVNLTGTGAIPLGRAGGGGYQFVDSQVVISASAGGVATLTSGENDPIIVQGTPLSLRITFTATGSLSFTDIDPVNDYFGLPSTFERTNVMVSNIVEEAGVCIADLTKPNYGCLPPMGLPFTGITGLRVDLPVDIDGNGLLDKILINPLMHEVGEILSTTGTPSTVTTTYTLNSILNGAVLDQASDPPFTINLTGPVTGTQTIVVNPIPEPGTYLLCGLALAGLVAVRRRKPQSALKDKLAAREA